MVADQGRCRLLGPELVFVAQHDAHVLRVQEVEQLFLVLEGRLDIDMLSLRPHMFVVDGIHNPPKTLLIREAEALGCTVLDGLGMLVNQGVISVKYWTGQNVDPSVMKHTVQDLLLN